jgi:hypothetical protein
LFAGEDVDLAVVEPEARAVLSHFDRTMILLVEAAGVMPVGD